MSYHPTVEKIKKLLQKEDFWFEEFEHQPVRTSEEAAKLRTGYSLKQGAKALIIKAGDNFVMLVLPADLKFDSSKVKKLLGVSSTRFATEEEIAEVADGIKIGGVPPFGNLFGLRVIVDPKLFENEKIVFNAGDRCFSIAMRSEDYKELVKPEVVNIT